MPSCLIEQCRHTLEAVLNKHSPQCVVVAYSGGVDSHVLLHLVAGLRTSFPQHQYQAIHVHHGLSANADEWQAHCQKACEQYGIALTSVRVKVEVKGRQSLEAQARKARYKALIEHSPNGAHLLLAQHQDDQLETVLLQLKRGAGPTGLAGMPMHHEQQGRQFHRPLLAVSQDTILAYAHQHQLQWIEDESNDDTRFDRNFLRHRILPTLTERWPGISTAVSRSARLCAEQQALLNEVAAQHLEQCRVRPRQLNRLALLALSEGWRKQVMRLWLSEQGIPAPSEVVLNRVSHELLTSTDPVAAQIQWQGYELRRFHDVIYVRASHTPIGPWQYEWQGERRLALSQGGQLLFSDKPHSDKVSFGGEHLLTIGQGGLNQRFRPQGAAHSKPLKQWFKQWRLPPWERESCIWLAQQGVVVALLGDDWVQQSAQVISAPVYCTRQGGKETPPIDPMNGDDLPL